MIRSFGPSLSKYLNISYVIIGGVMVGASWYLGRLALGPSGNGFEHPTSAQSLIFVLGSCLDQV